MAVTINVDQLTTDTKELYIRTVEDQVHDQIPLIYKLRRMRRVITRGGRYITKPVRYAKNLQTQHYGVGATLKSGTDAKRTQMRFEWKLTQTPIKYDVMDEIKNDGEAQIVDTIGEEVKAAQEDMVDSLSANFFGDYTGAGTMTASGSVPADAPLGLAQVFYGADVTYGGLATYGNVTRGAINDWADGLCDDLTTRNAATTVSWDQWDMIVSKCMQYRGNRNSMLAVTGEALWRKWKALVRSREGAIQKQGMLAKAGFASFEIDGIEVVLDHNCLANYFYMLNLDSWEWRISPGRNFKVTPFKWQGELTNGVDEYLARVLLAHTGLICWKPRVNYQACNMS